MLGLSSGLALSFALQTAYAAPSTAIQASPAIQARQSTAAQPARTPSVADQGAAEALLVDVERIVAGFEDGGWFIDEQVYSEVEPMLLQSLCRTSPAARELARQRLALSASVDPEALFRRTRQLDDAVTQALFFRRQWVALERALARAEQCPFWVRIEPGFEGRQTVRNKWSLQAEGGGLVELDRSGSELNLGAGGNGRLLLGRGLGDAISLIGGVELGGGAGLRSAEAGRLSFRYNPALPLLVRLHQQIWFYDVEVAPVAMFETDNTELSWGGRLGFTVGITALRTRDFLPWAGVTLGAEHYFEADGRPAFQLLRGGVRVGIRWLP